MPGLNDSGTDRFGDDASPSLSIDGNWIAFTSPRSRRSFDPVHSQQVYLYDRSTASFVTLPGIDVKDSFFPSIR